MKNLIKKLTALLLIVLLLASSMPNTAFADGSSDLTPVPTWRMSDSTSVASTISWTGNVYESATTQVSLSDDTNIWDGGTESQRFTSYSTTNSLNWTSWRQVNPVDLRRFQMTFDKPENVNVTNAVIESEKNGSSIGINDRMYVFVNGTLAFWGGTNVNSSMTINSVPGDLGVPVAGLAAGRDTGTYPESDGWFITQGVNIASMLVNGRNVIDIFTEEDAAGGGMDKLSIRYVNANIQHNVNFVDNSVSVHSESVNDGLTVAPYTVATKEGFIFDGWYNGETKFDFTTPIIAPLTLTAKWLPVNMYFSVDNQIEVYHNGTLLTPVFTPTLGSGEYQWQAIKQYFADIQTGDIIAVKGVDEGVVAGFIGEIRINNMTYPTQENSFWRQSEVEQTGWNTKNFNMNETWGPVSNKTYASWDNKLIGAPTGFNATWVWSANNDFTKTQNHVVYFRYVVGGYPTVTFDSNGGTEFDPMTVPAGTSLTGNSKTLPIPTKTGFTFTKWVLVETTTEFNGATIINNDLQVIAQYTPNVPDTTTTPGTTEGPVQTTEPTTEPPTAPATTQPTTEVITDEDVAEGGATISNFDSFIDESATEATTEAVEEVEIATEATPLADALPQTGQLPVELFYGVGGLITAAGVFLKKKN